MHKYETKHYKIIDTQNTPSEEFLKKCAYAYNENKKFFKKDIPQFNIFVTNTEEEFKKKTKRFYSPFTKGVGLRGKIILRGKKSYEESYKKYGGTKRFEILLTHEINHLYSIKLDLYYGPYWFTEGLAMYVAKQIPGKTFHIKRKITKNNINEVMFYRMQYIKLKNYMYTVHYYATEYLVKTYGREKLLKLIDSYKKHMKKKDYLKKFYNIYGITYDKFLKDSKEYVMGKIL